jgi:hypothetical protein
MGDGRSSEHPNNGGGEVIEHRSSSVLTTELPLSIRKSEATHSRELCSVRYLSGNGLATPNSCAEDSGRYCYALSERGI